MSDDDAGGSFVDAPSNDGASSDTSATADGAISDEPLSFFEQLWQSIVGVLIGVLLVFGSIAGVFWNENNSVQVARALDEGLGVTISAPADRLDPANEGKLVHVIGNLASRQGVRDDLLNVAAQGVRLQRQVEMYQWKESSSTKDGRRTYSYSAEWSSAPQDSSRFRDAANHRNPGFPFASQTFRAADATLGSYRLGEATLAAFQSRSETRVTPPQTAVDGAGRRANRSAALVDGELYLGRDQANPVVGDMKVSWRLIAAGPGSIAARQTAGEFSAYTARNGRPVLLAATGSHSAEAMFAQGQADNRLFTWIIRGVVLVFMFVGFFLMLGPFVFLASYVPVVGDLFAAGAGIIALVMTLIVGGGSIAIAWFAVRPLLTATIVGGVAAAVFGFKRLTRGKAEQKLAARRAAHLPAMPAR
jgi:Transmembrane protein 43